MQDQGAEFRARTAGCGQLIYWRLTKLAELWDRLDCLVPKAFGQRRLCWNHLDVPAD